VLDSLFLENKDYQFNDETDNKKSLGKINVYTDNIKDDIFLALNSYKGLYVINNTISTKIKDIKIFNKDVYSPTLTALVNDNYIIADYSATTEFSNFYIVNLKDDEYEILKSNKKISVNSYIAGIYDNKVYLIDKTNKKEYEIDIKNETVLEVGNVKNGALFYENGKLINKPFEQVNAQNLKFETYTKNDIYERIVKVNNIYYLFKKSGQEYKIYQAFDEKFTNPIYLFKTEFPDNISFFDNYVFYINENKGILFSSDIGYKTIFTYDELLFNPNIKLYGIKE
jgi:hypothetical protein